jgi:hypothetical protein
MGKQPAQAVQTTCPDDRRCHVSGKNLTVFGSAFSTSMVREIASSSVLLIDHSINAPMASGTLIADTVVLCAAHTMAFTGSNIDVLMFFECDQATAPPGMSDQYPPRDPVRLAAWRNCTRLRTNPQAKVVKVLEQGSDTTLDYALLAIQWTELAPDPQANIVELPRSPVARAASTRFSHEVLCVGHPILIAGGGGGAQTMSDVEPTQASAGILSQQFGPNLNTGQGNAYGYANMLTAFGMSGGGVFNDTGEIIGVLTGIVPGKGNVFLNLGEASNQARNSRLFNYVTQGDPLRPGDPHQTIVFRTKP